MKFVTESHGPRIEKLPAGTIQMWIGYRSPKLMEVTMSTGLPIDEHDGLLPTFKVLLEDQTHCHLVGLVELRYNL